MDNFAFLRVERILCRVSRRLRCRYLFILLLLMFTSAARSATFWYVDDDRPDDTGDGLSWGAAKKTIQATVDVAAEGDTIQVADGQYSPITTGNKAITISSLHGAGKTIIDGSGTVRCATLGSPDAQEHNTILDGFTLQNGYATPGGGACGGTLLNCILSGNSTPKGYATLGGGAYRSILSNCQLEGNYADHSGGGARDSTLTNCTLSRNYADYMGGGTFDCTLINCTLQDNAAYYGGGARYGTLTNCTLTDNIASRGGGASASTLTNCTVSGNSALYGGGVDSCDLYNCIVMGNTAVKDANYANSTFMYSCTEPLPSEGEGNISSAPKLVDAANGDCRLRTGSPCLDAGRNADVNGELPDLTGNPRIVNGTVDMGAFEGSVAGWVISGRVQGYGQINPGTALVLDGENATFQAESSRPFQHFLIDGKIVSESPTYTWANIQADGVIIAVFESKIWYVDADSPVENGDGSSWAKAKRTLQAAIDLAEDGDQILVEEGTYAPIVTDNKAITIFAVKGSGTTIIDGGKLARCATLGRFFPESDTVLNGFTLQNGKADNDGGGVRGGTLLNCILTGNSGSNGGAASQSTLTDCTLTSNSGSNSGGGASYCLLTDCILTGNSGTSGGAAYQSTLNSCTLNENTANNAGGASYCTLTNCTLTGNVAQDSGGGTCYGTLTNCTLTGNTAESGGGAYYGTLTNCTLTSNTANDYGGAASNGTLTGCVLRQNTAETTGGGGHASTLTNCSLSGNSADFGGGAYDSTLTNCTLTGNTATSTGGGVRECYVDNCIVWGNEDGWGGDGYNYSSSNLNYSCTFPLPGDGEGNIITDPMLVDAANGDCRLRPGSPCIDVGSNELVESTTDLAGNPRISNEIVDMGAYEGAANVFVITGRIHGRGDLSPLTVVVDPGSSATFVATETVPGVPFLHFAIAGETVSEELTYTWENIQADGVITAVFATNTWFVDAAQPNDEGDGLSWEAAKQTIQAAVAVAKKDDLIMVQDGIYAPIATYNKSVIIRSQNGAKKTIIDGGGVASCAILGDAPEEYNTILDGFTLQNGVAQDGGGACRGTLLNCILKSNAAEYAGGAYWSLLSNCFLFGNWASDEAGGAGGCTLINCTLTGNSAGSGGGANNCDLFNCILWGNSAPVNANHDYSLLMYSCTEPLPSEGDGNISQDPGFVDGANEDCRLRTTSPCLDAGGNVYADRATDFAGNPRIVNGRVDMGACEGGVAGFVISGRVQGSGTLSPMTATAMAGAAVTFEATATARPFSHFVVDGQQVSGSTSYTWGDIQDDGVIIAVFASATWHVDGSTGNDSNDGLTWDAAKKTIQAAIDAAVNGDLILVKNGTYASINTGSKQITIRSSNGAGATFISGGGTARCATLGATLPESNSLLEGFTLQNGRAVNGGGVWGGTLTACILKQNTAEENGGGACHSTLSLCTLNGNTSADGDGGGAWACFLSGCTLTGNKATEGNGGGAYVSTLTDCTVNNNSSWWGGGAYECTLSNCTLTGNSADSGGGAEGCTLSNCTLTQNRADSGGGVYDCTLTDCTLTSNSAESGGGADDSTLSNCTIVGNSAEKRGGGGYYSTLIHCVVRDNQAQTDDGGGAYRCTMSNCLLFGNSSGNRGGGAYWSTLNNCTVTGNSAVTGGGVNKSTLGNCIVWNNAATTDANHSGSTITFSCTEPSQAGAGNLSSDPCFVDGGAGDWRLTGASPCLDAGDNTLVAESTDLAGIPRILYGTVDMGAFEFSATSELPEGKYAWQSGWNTLFLPFDSLDQAETREPLSAMPMFRLDNSIYVTTAEVPLHTPLWVYCAEPESAPLLNGDLTAGEPADPLDIPVGQWSWIGAQRRIPELPDLYVAWQWQAGKYSWRNSLQPGQVYYIYRKANQ